MARRQSTGLSLVGGFLCLLAAAQGCGGENDSNTPAPAPTTMEPVCAAGDQRECVARRGTVACQGTQVCLSDRTGYGECVCPGTQPEGGAGGQPNTGTGGDDSGGEAGSTQNLGGEGGTVTGGQGGEGGEPCVATGADVCNGLDDDCDPSTADGYHEPDFGDACDGDDGDLCEEGTLVCNGTEMVCSDETSSTVELCAGDGEDEDCDGDADEGFVMDTIGDGICPTAIDIGSASGDSGTVDVVHYTAESYEEAVYKLKLTEDDAVNDFYLGARVTLVSPPGADYDLYVYCMACTNPIAISSVKTTATDMVEIYITDTAADDDTDLIIKIQNWALGTTQCGNWELTVETNSLSEETPICAPPPP